jgi:hypothetical protein
LIQKTNEGVLAISHLESMAEVSDIYCKPRFILADIFMVREVLISAHLSMTQNGLWFMPSASISSRTVERFCGNVVVLPGTAPRAGDVYHA